MLGVYFSGTGNTKHCVETFMRCYDENRGVVSIEQPDVLEQVAAQDTLVLGYPVYFSNIPKIVRDFLANNAGAFAGKRVFLIATMGLFSGDGAGVAARLLKKNGASVLGGLHLKMPDCVGDVKLLKKPLAKNREIVARADAEIAAAAHCLKAGKPTRDGLSALHRVAGLVAQRLWCRPQAERYQQKPQIDGQKCTGCGRCAALCPMGNLSLQAGKMCGAGRCTLCYRCLGHCPQRAITILGGQVHEQCLFERYAV